MKDSEGYEVYDPYDYLPLGAKLVITRIEDMENRLPKLTPGAYDSLTKSEAYKLNEVHRINRLAREDIYDLDSDIRTEPDVKCATSHIVEAAAIAAYF